MRRLNLYSLLVTVHVLLIAITVIGSLYVFAIGKTDWLIPFLTIPIINILLIPITRKGEKFDPTHPIFLILSSLVLGTVIRSFFVVSPMQYDTKFLMLMGKPPTVLLKGISAIYLGIICFVIGYTYPAKPLSNWSQKKVFFYEISLKKLVPVALLLTVISLVVAFLFFKKMGVNFSDINDISQKRHYQVDEGSYSALGYYRLFMDLIEPVFYMFLVYIISKKKKIFSFLGLFTIFLCTLNLTYQFMVSSRTSALYILINTGLVIYYLKGKIKLHFLISVVAIASVMLFIMTAIRETHSKIRSETSVSTNPIVIMATSLNFLGVDKTSQIIDKMPERLNYEFGKSLFLWVVAPVPRTMWPQKPDITEGREIGEMIYQKRDENSPGGGVPPGFIAEMYLNFGYLGIIVGMFIFGLMLKQFYNAFKKVREKTIFGMVAYLVAFAPFPFRIIGGDFSGCVVQILTTIIPIYLIMKLVQKAPQT